MKKVYVLGDSISIQYGPYLERGLRNVLAYSRKEAAEETGLKLEQPQGANGGNSVMVRAFLEAKLAQSPIDADLVLLNCGLHDIRTDLSTGVQLVPLERYRENLQAILDLVAKGGKQVIWVRTTPVDDEVHNSAGVAFNRFASVCEKYNQAADEIMTKAGVPILDLFTFTKNLGTAKDLYQDHVHFTEPVRAQQGAFIAGWLTAFVQQRGV